VDNSGKLNLEEPPPIQRAASPTKIRRPFGSFFTRPKRLSAPNRNRDLRAATRSESARSVWPSLVALIALVALAAVGVLGWQYRSVTRELAEQRSRLEQTNQALTQSWEATKGLDQDRMRSLAVLADSVRSELQATQDQARLWEKTYANLEQRMDQRYRSLARVVRIDPLGRARLEALERQDRTQRSALESLERQARGYRSALDAFSRRAQTQESVIRDLSISNAYLRETLRKVESAQQPGAATVGYGTLSRRVDNLSTWADGFHRAGLSGDGIQKQISTLVDELRSMRLRVDSLRPVGRMGSSTGMR
jgi:hypothetical protein